MAIYLSPLVDVNEIDLSTTVPNVATSIGVTVLRNTYKGPELKRTLITKTDDLIDTFGEPTSGSYEDILSATGYFKYGKQLYCTRAMPSTATFAGCYDTFGAASTPTAYTTGATGAYLMSDLESDDPDEFGTEDIVFDSTREDTGADVAFIASSRGRWGNLIKVAYVGKDKYNTITQATSGGVSTDMYNDIKDQVDKDIGTDSASDYDFLVIVKAADQDQLSYADDSDRAYTVVETFIVSTNERRLDDEGNNIFAENIINNQSKYIRINIAAGAKMKDMSEYYSSDYITLAGGQDTAFVSDAAQDVEVQAAFDLYEDPELIDINLFIDSNKTMTTKAYLIELCEARKDCMVILDVPKSMVVNNSGSEASDLRSMRWNSHSTYNLNESTSYAAMYGNWLNIFDKWNGLYRWIPSSGHVSGIYANTDNVTDAWFAPAGLNRGQIFGVRKLAWNPNESYRDILYKNGINPIVSFAGQGKVIYGQKNLLSKTSAFNRVNVRRLFIVLEKAISTISKYFLFEPNDDTTRVQMIDTVTPYLRDIKARRGIYDFEVVCDDRNNTSERIDRSELWMDIYIKPVKAAEFIVLNFIATKTGASFNELIAASVPE